jgi:hypothetical protein
LTQEPPRQIKPLKTPNYAKKERKENKKMPAGIGRRMGATQKTRLFNAVL